MTFPCRPCRARTIAYVLKQRGYGRDEYVASSARLGGYFTTQNQHAALRFGQRAYAVRFCAALSRSNYHRQGCRVVRLVRHP